MATNAPVPLWIALALAAYLSVQMAVYGADLTRGTGLVYYPEPGNGDQSHTNHTGQFRQAANLGRIRITLTRNISYLYSSKLMAPEVSYFGAVGVGSPPKMFNVVFDTGSSETWLPYYNWFPLANNLHYSDGYSCRDSGTCEANRREYSVDYRTTKMTGETYTDRFTLYEDMSKDDATVMVAPNLSFDQNFLGIEDASDEQFRYKPYDGVIGMAPVAQSSSGTRNILLSMQLENQRGGNSFQSPAQQQQNQLQHPLPAHHGSGNYYNQPSPLVFGFWFNSNHNSRYGGELMIGGVDESRLSGEIYFHRVSSWFDWQLPLMYVMLGGQVISCSNGCSVTLDTGANSLVGPREDVENIYDEIQAQHDKDSNLWLVDCDRIDQYPMVVFRIDDTPYTLYPRHYIQMFRFRENIICHLAIKPWNNQGWLLGTSFIGAYYTVFDFDSRRVGFATPRN